MKLQDLRRGYLPILLSFAAPPLILQTDLVMVATLGTEATAAYGVPLRVALLDAVLMMALGSVTSVVVAGAAREGRAAEAAHGALAVALLLGLLVTAVGLLLYPQLAHWVTADPTVAELAAEALFWYALATPFRFLAAVAVMALHALGDGVAVLRWKLTEVGLNALLDALFIFALGLGFAGAFLATFGVLLAGSLWSLARLHRHLATPLRRPTTQWLRGFLGQCGWEAKRVLANQLFALLGMVLFATTLIAPLDLDRLAAYSAGSALALLLFMPALALFRFLAFRLGGVPPTEITPLLRQLLRYGLPPLLLLAALLLAIGQPLGQRLYGLSGPWWGAAVALMALTLPVRFINALQRGALQAGGGFASVALVDSAVLWGIGLPLMALGLQLNQPALTFSYILLPELCALPLLWWRLSPLLAPAGTGSTTPLTCDHNYKRPTP